MGRRKARGKKLGPYNRPIDFTEEEVRELFNVCELKEVDGPRPEVWWSDQGVQICIDGTWRELIRTDLFDDVQTGRRYSVEQWREKAQKTLGARIGDTYFALIDSFSDG